MEFILNYLHKMFIQLVSNFPLQVFWQHNVTFYTSIIVLSSAIYIYMPLNKKKNNYKCSTSTKYQNVFQVCAKPKLFIQTTKMS